MHSVSMTPPSRGRGSKRRKGMPARCRSKAAVRPESPPPAMITMGYGAAFRAVNRLKAGPQAESPPHQRLSWFELADHLDNGLHVVYRRFGKDAVAQVEDVARTRPCSAQQFVDSNLELGHGREQDHGVEIPLNGGAVADVHPGLVDIEAPV